MLLDTNVLSEAYRDVPDDGVLAFLAGLDMDQTFTSVVVMGELRFGAVMLAPGRRRSQMEEWIEGVRAQFAGRILPVDEAVAARWADLRVAVRAVGRDLGTADGLIAATALMYGLPVATRNVRHFRPTGVEIVDPWEKN